jgi:replication factor C small subunit
MKIIDNKHFIWAERYRPQTLDDVILPEEMRKQFNGYIKEGRFPHLLLSSVNPGLGKTSIVNAIVKDLDADVKWINGSQDRGISTFRDEVKEFITSVSFDDSPKIVLIDEADGLTPEAQKILRGLIEEFSKHSTFIMTCNYKEQLIEPLRNRFIHFDFDSLYNQNKKDIGLQVYKRLQFILDNEHIEYDQKDLSPIVQNMFPSVRKMVLTLQQSVQNNKLEINEKMINLATKYTAILDLIKEKNFIEVRKRLQDLDEPGSLYTFIFKHIDEWFTPEAQPQVILLCAKYADMNERARDKAINTAAFAVELMLTPGINFI